MTANTIRIHRVLRAPPERVYKAFFMDTITLKVVSVGTDVTIVQEGVPAVIPADGCYLGWQESLI
jgi:hypothetical protein